MPLKLLNLPLLLEQEEQRDSKIALERNTHRDEESPTPSRLESKSLSD